MGLEERRNYWPAMDDVEPPMNERLAAAIAATLIFVLILAVGFVGGYLAGRERERRAIYIEVCSKYVDADAYIEECRSENR